MQRKPRMKRFCQQRECSQNTGARTAYGEKSRQVLDPGAAVADLMMKGYADFVANR
jgi:hypothetical protein